MGTAKRLLVVEDEFVIALDVQQMLERAGHRVLACAGNVPDALRLAGELELDGAVLDINLQDQSIAPVADTLKARGVPFVFVSGYDDKDRPPGHDDAPVLRKPYREAALLAAVAAF